MTEPPDKLTAGLEDIYDAAQFICRVARTIKPEPQPASRAEGRKIRLSPVLKALHRALSESPRTWMTAEDLIAKLAVDGKHRKRGAIGQAACRLRKELERQGVNAQIKGEHGLGWCWISATNSDKS